MSNPSQEGVNMETGVCGQVDFVDEDGEFASIKADNGRLYGSTDLETIKILAEHMEKKEVVRVRFTAVRKGHFAIAKNIVVVEDEEPVVPAAPPTTHHHVPQVSPALQQTAPDTSISTTAQAYNENGAAPIGFSLPAPSTKVVQLRLHRRPEASPAVAAQPAPVARKTSDAAQSVPKSDMSSSSIIAPVSNGIALMAPIAFQQIGSSSTVTSAFTRVVQQASAAMASQLATGARKTAAVQPLQQQTAATQSDEGAWNAPSAMPTIDAFVSGGISGFRPTPMRAMDGLPSGIVLRPSSTGQVPSVVQPPLSPNNISQTSLGGGSAGIQRFGLPQKSDSSFLRGIQATGIATSPHQRTMPVSSNRQVRNVVQPSASPNTTAQTHGASNTGGFQPTGNTQRRGFDPLDPSFSRSDQPTGSAVPPQQRPTAASSTGQVRSAVQPPASPTAFAQAHGASNTGGFQAAVGTAQRSGFDPLDPSFSRNVQPIGIAEPPQQRTTTGQVRSHVQPTVSAQTHGASNSGGFKTSATQRSGFGIALPPQQHTTAASSTGQVRSAVQPPASSTASAQTHGASNTGGFLAAPARNTQQDNGFPAVPPTYAFHGTFHGTFQQHTASSKLRPVVRPSLAPSSVPATSAFSGGVQQASLPGSSTGQASNDVNQPTARGSYIGKVKNPYVSAAVVEEPQRHDSPEPLPRSTSEREVVTPQQALEPAKVLAVEEEREYEMRLLLNKWYLNPAQFNRDSYPFPCGGFVVPCHENKTIMVFTRRLGLVVRNEDPGRRGRPYAYFMVYGPNNYGAWEYDGSQPPSFKSTKYINSNEIELKGYALMAPAGRNDPETSWYAWNDHTGFMRCLSNCARVLKKKYANWEPTIQMVMFDATSDNNGKQWFIRSISYIDYQFTTNQGLWPKQAYYIDDFRPLPEDDQPNRKHELVMYSETIGDTAVVYLNHIRHKPSDKRLLYETIFGGIVITNWGEGGLGRKLQCLMAAPECMFRTREMKSYLEVSQALAVHNWNTDIALAPEAPPMTHFGNAFDALSQQPRRPP